MIAANANVRSVKYTQTILDITNRVEHCELDSRSFDTLADFRNAVTIGLGRKFATNRLSHFSHVLNMSSDMFYCSLRKLHQRS